MGLQITKVDPRFGVDIEYWKVGNVVVSWHDQKCKANLLGFVNRAQRDDGKDSVMTQPFSFIADDFNFVVDQPLLSQIYEKIKLEEGWTESADILE